MCNKADNSCRQEKLGCKGCFYKEKGLIDIILNTDFLEDMCSEETANEYKKAIKEELKEIIQKAFEDGQESIVKRYISKDKIRNDLKICQEVFEKEMKPYQTEYGLDVTYLSKKEKAELINKRNCLLTQMKTYEMLLEE